MQVVVRSWRREDEHEVQAVLREGSFSNLWSSFCVALRRPTTFIVVFIILAVCIGCGYGFLMTLTTIVCFTVFIYLTCLIATLYFFYGPNFNDMKHVETTYFSKRENHFWVAEVDGEVVGTIAVVRKQNETKVSFENHCRNRQNVSASNETQMNHTSAPQENSDCRTFPLRKAWLRRMAVKHKFRGRGIAKQLVQAVINFCRERDYDAIFLITTEVHQPARALYASMGFKEKNFKPYKHLHGLINVWTYEFEMVLNNDIAD